MFEATITRLKFTNHINLFMVNQELIRKTRCPNLFLNIEQLFGPIFTKLVEKKDDGGKKGTVINNENVVAFSFLI
jgi:hypothetical protein